MNGMEMVERYKIKMARIVSSCLLIVAECLAVLSAQAKSPAAVLLDDDWQFYPMPGFSLWPAQAQLTPRRLPN